MKESCLYKTENKEIYNWEGKTILLIDTSIVNHSLHKIHFKKTGVNFISTDNICKGLVSCFKNAPDVVISEIRFKNENLYDHIFWFRQIDNTPVIIQTTQNFKFCFDKCYSMGSCAVFPKPPDWEKYMAFINELLTKRKGYDDIHI